MFTVASTNQKQWRMSIITLYYFLFQKNCPNSSSKKAVYEKFLRDREIDVDNDLTRPDLWMLVKQELSVDPPCVVDDMAAQTWY